MGLPVALPLCMAKRYLCLCIHFMVMYTHVCFLTKKCMCNFIYQYLQLGDGYCSLFSWVIYSDTSAHAGFSIVVQLTRLTKCMNHLTALIESDCFNRRSNQTCLLDLLAIVMVGPQRLMVWPQPPLGPALAILYPCGFNSLIQILY